MKKVFLLSTLFAAAIAMTSCSDDKDLGQGTSPYGTGDSYLSLAIQLPTQPKSRAESTLADGLNQEFAVKDATLILFRGTSENTATYLSNYDLGLPDAWDKDDDDAQITSVAEIVQAINSTDKPTEENDKLYAYVVLNKKQSNLESILQNAKVGESTFYNLFGSSNVISNDINRDTYGFVMTNAPLATSTSGQEYTVLSEIDSEKIFATPEKAKGQPATVVHVERNVAKVTVTAEGGFLKIKNSTENLKDDNKETIPYKITGWVLDNTAPSTYFQRQIENPQGNENSFTFKMPEWYNYRSDVSGTDNNTPTTTEDVSRFIGNTVIGSKYRIYWGYSPRYFTQATDLVKNTTTVDGIGEKNPQYCYENTFNVANQMVSHTTQVLLKAEINKGKDFYTVGKTINEDKDVAVEYWGKADGSTDNLKKKVIHTLSIDGNVQTAMGEGKKFQPNVSESSVKFKTVGNTVTVEEVVLKNNAAGRELKISTDNELKYVLEAYFNGSEAKNPILYYENGVVYYRVLIKHFGDESTPWNAEDHINTASYVNEGETEPSEKDYLGRYGVLRNNWYNINITGISDFGSPVVPALPEPDQTDDVTKNYIAVKIQILSWAVRNQNTEL